MSKLTISELVEAVRGKERQMEKWTILQQLGAATPAFVTGSREYGTPRPDSDLDLVMFMSDADLDALAVFHAEHVLQETHDLEKFVDEDGKTETKAVTPSMTWQENTLSLRFGPLNIIATSNRYLYESWRKGTIRLIDEACASGGSVTRDRAIEVFDELREEARIHQTVADAL